MAENLDVDDRKILDQYRSLVDLDNWARLIVVSEEGACVRALDAVCNGPAHADIATCAELVIHIHSELKWPQIRFFNTRG